jgi:phage N-6-adenine-methyltransferase
MDTTTQKIMFSSKSDEWGTPEDFFHKLNRRYKFTLDPCSSHKNKKCQSYYTIEDDGLTKDWGNERVFVNPPYGDIKKWVEKSYRAAQEGAFVVMLIPARTDTKYWHDYVMKSSRVYFVKGRLKFDNGSEKKNAAPFPSAVVVFGEMCWGPSPVIQTIER